MAGKKRQADKESSSNQLRADAEKKVARSADKSALLKKQGLDKLVHELQIHQVELEMQNEELRSAQGQLEKSRNDYADLYDFSPVGYLTFSGDALITGVNLTGAALLGVERPKLFKRRFRAFVAPADAERWDRHFVSVLQQGEKQSCDLQLRRSDGSTLLARLDSIRVEMDDGTRVVRTAMCDITAQREAEEALKVGEKKYLEVLQRIIEAMSQFNESRDPYTTRHEHRVTELTCAIAAEMGFPQEQIEGIRLGSYIHDSGKIAVPLEILMHQGKLDEMQMSLVRAHPQNAYAILVDIDFPWPIALTIWQHHERLDGSGYPQGLRGGDIILEAKILAVADVVEAMASARPYRAAPGIDKALEEISKNRGKLYDPVVVDACLKLFQKEGFKFTEPGLQDTFS